MKDRLTGLMTRLRFAIRKFRIGSIYRTKGLYKCRGPAFIAAVAAVRARHRDANGCIRDDVTEVFMFPIPTRLRPARLIAASVLAVAAPVLALGASAVTNTATAATLPCDIYAGG